jgi:mono/diheme cytochrome c family protein
MTFHRIACLLAGLIVLPIAAFADPGLIARYSDGKNTVQTIAGSPAFTLRDNESVHPQIGTKFTANYDGSLKVLRRGKYIFTCDGKLSIDGKEITAPVELDAGEHAISIAYERKAGAARLQPVWASDLFIAEPIPASVLSHAKAPREAEDQALIDQGRMIVEEHNCAGCHKNGAQGLVNRIGPDLSNIGGRANAFWIYKWLENPKHFRATAVMPVLLTKEEDRRDAAAYLATLKDTRKRIGEYKHSAQKENEGKQLFSSIGCANCHNDAGPSLTGMGSKTTIGQLAAYLEEPTNIDRSGRMPAMNLSKEEAVALADHLVQSKSDDYNGKLPEGADAKHGEQLIRTAGCLNCHTIDGAAAGKPLPETKKFPALDKLDPTKGCLAENPPEGAANYSFSPTQRQAAAAFLTAIKTVPLISSAPAYEFHRTLQKMNCSACHETDDAKPVSEDAEKLPPLSNVGAKLKREWIQQVLNDRRARVRFWLKTRMPEFGGAVSNVGAQAVAAAGIDENEPKVAINPHAIAQGQELVGANDPKKNPTGMGCVTCHSLREFKPAVAADATRGPELTLMSTRLRQDFFRRWMHDPARIQPGTAMPNFFTDKSREEADLTIGVLWSYASLGIAMPAPKGIKEKKNYILIVTDTPLLQRCQVPDSAGTIVDGISVGLPEMINYTFDADQCIFRTAWAGPFLDMSGDWADRGGNPVRVLGKRFYSQATPPIHIGSPDSNEPRVFKGYELKDKIPTFTYTIGDVEVRERITPLPTGDGIVRTFELDPNNKPVYFTATDDPSVTLTINNGQFKPAQVQKSFKSPDKAAGQIAELPSAGKLTFAVTIRAKENK